MYTRENNHTEQKFALFQKLALTLSLQMILKLIKPKTSAGEWTW